MRELIKKILFEEFHSNKIIIEEISINEFKKYLLLTEGIATVKPDKDKMAKVENQIENFYNHTNEKEQRVYKDNNYNIDFKIIPTYHWFQRLNRKDEPEYAKRNDILNPETEEGVDLIIKRIDKIVKYTFNNNWKTRKEICIKLISSYYSNNKYVEYTNLLNIEKDFKNHNTYYIKMITNFKGPKFMDNKYNDCLQWK